jgi:hypothetical protein
MKPYTTRQSTDDKNEKFIGKNSLNKLWEERLHGRFIPLMMEAICTYETSVYSETTSQKAPIFTLHGRLLYYVQ